MMHCNLQWWSLLLLYFPESQVCVGFQWHDSRKAVGGSLFGCYFSHSRKWNQYFPLLPLPAWSRGGTCKSVLIPHGAIHCTLISCLFLRNIEKLGWGAALITYAYFYTGIKKMTWRSLRIFQRRDCVPVFCCTIWCLRWQKRIQTPCKDFLPFLPVRWMERCPPGCPVLSLLNERRSSIWPGATLCHSVLNMHASTATHNATFIPVI